MELHRGWLALLLISGTNICYCLISCTWIFWASKWRLLFSHELLFPWPCLMLWFFHSSSSFSFACRLSSDSFVLRAWCVWILSCELLDSFVGQWEVLLFCTKRLENLSVRSVCFGKFSIGFFGSSDLIISSPETFVRSLIFGGQW